MATTQIEPLTAADYRELPEAGPRYQLIEGELHMAPAPNRFHQDIAGNIYWLLRNHLVNRATGKVYIAPFDVYLSDVDVFQPDVLFVSNENLSILKEDGCHGAPDLIVEVLSPATAQLDKKSKRRVYARSGVKELWLVDPILEQIHVYDLIRNPEKESRIVDENESFESPLLPGLVIQAKQVFARQS
jgi:Uma2 family endonuclease